MQPKRPFISNNPQNHASVMAGSRWVRVVGAVLVLATTAPIVAAVLPDNKFLKPSVGNLKKLPDKNSNVGAMCPSECLCEMNRVECVADTSSKTLPPVVPASSSSLSLSDYDLNNIQLDYLETFADLRLLKLHNSKLRSIPRIPNLPFLSHLDISDNLISNMGYDSYILAPRITHLNISDNLIKTLDQMMLKGFPYLQVLDLSRNPLTIITVNAFKLLPKVEYLDLSQTEVSEVNNKWLTDMPRLYSLNVSHAKLTGVLALFSKSLNIFDISYNAVDSFPILKNLTNLSELYIMHTNISNVSKKSTAGATKLRVLDMSYTLVQSIRDELSVFKLIIHIDLSNNKYLKHIKHNSFTGLTKLETLHLNHCPSLYDIENLAFLDLHNLLVLDMRDTAIKVLPSSIRMLNKLTTFQLDNTALLCDCHAYSLPKWLINVVNSTWTGVSPLKCEDGVHRKHEELQKYHQDLGCKPVQIHTQTGEWLHIIWGQSALLECNVTGEPQPLIIWQTSQQKLYLYRDNSTYQEGWPWFGEKIGNAVAGAVTSDEDVQVLQSGHLLVNKVSHKTVGRYKCFAINAVSHSSIETFVGEDDGAIRSLKLESFLFGISCATLFLLITLIVQFIRYLIERLDCECCCCCKDRLSPKAKQIRKLLESVETYKAQQLERLRENYNSQVVGIKDSCYQQMEKLREGYTQQTRNLKDLRDYSTQGLQTVRDQYVDQVNKVGEYSTTQMNRVRENYVFQRHKIRKFSAHQLVKLRETYKYQQKTLNKLLENLPDLYLQNCRTGGCQRTDSLIFNNELQGLDSYYKLDFLEVQSYEGSDYYTPNSTLTRAGRRNDSKKRHSRTSSNTSSSTVFQEAQSWITRKDSSSICGIQSPNQGKSHTRSFSIAAPQTVVSHSKPKLGHRRSLSATQSKQKLSPRSSRPTVMEEVCNEQADRRIDTPMFSCAPSLSSSPAQTPLHTPYDSPYHCQTAPTTPSHAQRPINSLLAPTHHISKISETKAKVESMIKPDVKMTKSESTEPCLESCEYNEHSSNNSVCEENLDINTSANFSDVDCEASYNSIKDTITEILSDDNTSISEVNDALLTVIVEKGEVRSSNETPL